MINISGLTVVAVAGALLLGACSKPYSTPYFDAGQGELRPTNPAVQFEGFASHINKQRPAKVFWTHGMCSHNWNWVMSTNSLIRAALRAKTDITTPEPRTAGAVTWMTSIVTPDGTLEASFYLWSPLTWDLKDTLRFDNATGTQAGFRYDRAPLNEVLKKKLLNDCLADAVIVSGSNRSKIYEETRSSICSFLGGNLTGASECTLSGPEPADTPRVIVAESLGSKIIADAVLDLTAAPGQEAEFSERLSTIRQVFLLANQIPLLDLSDAVVSTAVGPSQSSLSRMLQKLGEATEPRNVTPIQVVSFTDPNDLLSYRLTERYVDANKTDLINVMVSNDWTYTVPFVETLSLERPDTAHCDYQRNDNVIAMVAVGNPGQGQNTWQAVSKRIDSDEKKGCGF
ncbi:MAG: hypothetical protein RIC29_05090 [Rhodospirillaceae bacterium]